MNYNDNDRDTNGKYTRTTTTTNEPAKKAGLGIGAILLIIALAVGAWFLFNNKDDTPASARQDVGQATSTVVEKVKDVAAEVPQAAKDATTEGDQKTTRPNDDESKAKLDQK